MLDLARSAGVTMPHDSAEALGEYMIVRSARNLEEYLARFEVTLSVMQTAEALERCAFELAEDAAAEGVRYLEVRFCPALNVRGGLTLPQVVEAVLRGLRRAERDLAIVCRVIICGLRSLAPDLSLRLARLAVDFRADGVVGFDLAGGEAGHPAAEHQEAFHLAAAHGISCTCHAGEGDGAVSIRSAIYDCGATRIGHGTRLFEDEALLEDVRRSGVTLEMCLTSNVQTHAVESITAHPARHYFDAGLSVVLNTDNRLMSGVTLVDEYYSAATALGFTVAELSAIALNGFRAAFLPATERNALVAQVAGELAALGVTA